MPSGPNSGSPNSESATADGRWRVPHDDWPVRGDSSVQFMDTQLDALPTLPVLARGVSGCVNSAFLDISRHFTAHLFSPWIPSSARGLDGGPLAPLSGNPSGEVACWYESSHNPRVWSLADLPSNEHRTCSTPAWWHRILTTPSSEWEGRSSGSSGKDGSSESST